MVWFTTGVNWADSARLDLGEPPHGAECLGFWMYLWLQMAWCPPRKAPSWPCGLLQKHKSHLGLICKWQKREVICLHFLYIPCLCLKSQVKLRDSVLLVYREWLYRKLPSHVIFLQLSRALVTRFNLSSPKLVETEPIKLILNINIKIFPLAYTSKT